MGYVAAKGGLEAIEAAERLVRRARIADASPWLELEQITGRLRLAVDRVQSEGGLWAPELSARALRQAEGDVIEAAQLVRSHRSSLPRLAYSATTEADEMRVVRRIVPAYRNPPGPQLLGRTLDYTGRLLDLLDESDARAEGALLAATDHEHLVASEAAPATDGSADTGLDVERESEQHPVRLLEVLRSMDLVFDRRGADDPEPYDITRHPTRPGVPRSAWLSTMARAETGALVNLWYRNIMGSDNHLHEITLGEVRHGYLPVKVEHPLTGGTVCIGEIRATEVEAIEDLDGLDEDRSRFDVGYGLVMGHNERKAIAMANLDIALVRDLGRSSLAQSVLLTTDGLDASGFLEHLKLPHYVTFRSMVERKMAVRA